MWFVRKLLLVYVYMCLRLASFTYLYDGKGSVSLTRLDVYQVCSYSPVNVYAGLAIGHQVSSEGEGDGGHELTQEEHGGHADDHHC